MRSKTGLTLLPLALGSIHTAFAEAPMGLPFSPLLAKEYSDEISLDWQSWLLSEKLDGIRAIWTGKTLVTRNGHRLYPPASFTASLPDFPMEGELWAGRDAFHQVMQTVLDDTPDQLAWRSIQFRVFDLPDRIEAFDARYQLLAKIITQLNQPHIRLVTQIKVRDKVEAQQYLQEVIDAGGEGVMLRDKQSLYIQGRDASLMKWKLAQDAEATVIAHLQGQGKFSEVMGALLVELDNGIQFKIGTGFTVAERHSPPAIGEKVTFKYNGLTQNGIPKFARFHRIDRSK